MNAQIEMKTVELMDAPIQRQQHYIPDRDGALFAWLHRSDAISNRDCVAVICNPIGNEYSRCHRSLRHLADQLAAAGIATLRFDYHGMGDSPGSDLDSERLQTWLSNIQTAIAFAQAKTGCTKICLIGVRIGATLAALLAAQQAIDWLVLWNPVIRGNRYLREMKATAAVSELKKLGDGVIESAGFLITQETAEQLAPVNLAELKYQVRQRVLIIQRDDLSVDSSLFEQLKSSHIGADEMVLPGYAEMTAEPHATKIPLLAFDTIKQWLCEQTIAVNNAKLFTTDAALASNQFSELDERPCFFGQHQQLFGVMCSPQRTKPNSAVVLMINSGSVHHVGSNRLYVLLARHLAVQGISSLRMDVGGLGDSVVNDIERENDPYLSRALNDVDSALDFLQQQDSQRPVILLGLCSGSYWAFQAAIALTTRPIIHAVLINPLTYHWVDGMSLETVPVDMQKVAYLRNAMARGDKWKKLLTGKAKINLRRSLGVLFDHLKFRIKQFFVSSKQSRLSTQLRQIFAQQRSLSLIVAGIDPGFDLLMAQAKATAIKAMKEGALTVEFIAKSDHTFSNWPGRQELLERVSKQIQQLEASRNEG